MVHLCKQCQCLPICFITFDLTNQKQEIKNFDCETSWLVYICELILARAKPYRNVLKLSFINDKSWRDGCANLCPWSLGKRRNSTSVYSIPGEFNFNHRRGGHRHFFLKIRCKSATNHNLFVFSLFELWAYKWQRLIKVIWWKKLSCDRSRF